MKAYERLPELPDIRDEGFRSARMARIGSFLQRIYDRSPLYREKFDAVGIAPSQIRTWEDFRNLPIRLEKADERRSQEWSLRDRGDPLGIHLCVDPSEVLAVTGTSGTTGMPAFSYQYTRRDLDSAVELWRRASRWMGIDRGDLVFDLMGYSMGSVGVPALHAFWQLGIRAFPVPAESGSERILYLMNLFRPKHLICTPSFAEYLGERAPVMIRKPVRDLGIETIMVAGEPGGGLPAFREKIQELYGARLYDAQIGSLGICNISCPAKEYTGMHQLAPDMQVWPEDIVSLSDNQPIEPVDGVSGRMLLTSFVQEARPVLKLDMGDIWQVRSDPCPHCGFRGLRYSIVGRTDDMLIVKGVNVYPSALKNVVEEFNPRVTGHFRILLDGPPPLVKPPLRLKVEHGAQIKAHQLPELAHAIKDRMHGLLKVTPEIEMVPPGSLPRTEMKTKYLELIGSG